jgi:NADH dehydrogenase [ubiquinone] 1 alpha subcomplex assembly factor 6
VEDLNKSAYFEMREVEEYAERTYSNMFYLLLEHAKISSMQADHIASHIGKAQGIVAFLRGAFPLAQSGFEAGLPVSLLAKHGISQQMICDDKLVWQNDPTRQVIHEIADTAFANIRKALHHMKDLPSNNSNDLLRILLPIIIPRGYLETLQSVDFDLSSHELYKTDRWLPIRLAWYISHPKKYIFTEK